MQRFKEDNSRLIERARMVDEQLARRGVRDERVLDAMRHVPREHFIPADQADYAYADGALPIEHGQTISQPYMVGRMTELLELRGGERVLEIGTGSGYQAAVLGLLAGTVFTIERQGDLLRKAEKLIGELGLRNLSYRAGDGTLGWPEEAPFHAIMVTAGAPEMPPALREQLAPGGRMVVPVGRPNDQTLVVVRRREEGDFEEQEILKCRFVKLIGEEGWRE